MPQLSSMLQFVYTNFLKKAGHQTCLLHQHQCNKVRVIVIIFSCSDDFALYLEDYFMDSCDNWNIGSV